MESQIMMERVIGLNWKNISIFFSRAFIDGKKRHLGQHGEEV